MNLDSVTDKFTVILEGAEAVVRLVSCLELFPTFEVAVAIAENHL